MARNKDKRRKMGPREAGQKGGNAPHRKRGQSGEGDLGA
jgi:hypothetical protein